jgi:hypothetical protein
MPPSLPSQPLPPRRQPYPQPHQRRADQPIAHPKLGGDPRDAVAGVAAGLQVPAQVPLEAERTGAFLQVPIAAGIDDEPALKAQAMTCSRWS